MYCHSSPTLLTLQFIININRTVATISGLLETISIHLWANVEKFDSLHKPNTNTVGIALYHNDNSQLPLSQLKAGRSRTTVVRRLLYFWEARDVKKVIELMEIDIVLVD
ncbi:unnamed protein product, partial [Brassica oleracea]